MDFQISRLYKNNTNIQYAEQDNNIFKNNNNIVYSIL